MMLKKNPDKRKSANELLDKLWMIGKTKMQIREKTQSYI